MVIDKAILDELTAKAKESQRRRVTFDLRDTINEQSQRMLNAIEPETVMPIHRHKSTSEVVICVRGHFEEYLYDDNGVLTKKVDMVPGGIVVSIPAGQWHNLKSLESGTVLLAMKNGAFKPLSDEDILK